MKPRPCNAIDVARLKSGRCPECLLGNLQRGPRGGDAENILCRVCWNEFVVGTITDFCTWVGVARPDRIAFYDQLLFQEKRERERMSMASDPSNPFDGVELSELSRLFDESQRINRDSALSQAIKERERELERRRQIPQKSVNGIMEALDMITERALVGRSRDTNDIDCKAIGCKFNKGEKCVVPTRHNIGADGRCTGFEPLAPEEQNRPGGRKFDLDGD